VAEARVSLERTSAQLVLRVEDDGIGFDIESIRSEPGLGLSSMIERVRLIGADLSIVSSPGRGTVIEVLVELARSTS
jgi:signal transduction histidine kinase